MSIIMERERQRKWHNSKIKIYRQHKREKNNRIERQNIGRLPIVSY